MLTLSGSAYPFHDSILQPCPGHKRKNGLPLDFTPELNEFWTAHPRETFGSRTDAFSTQFTGFSICHPMYDNKHMLKVVQHATASALKNQEATATFLLLPNWMKTAPTLFTKPALATRMFALYLEISQRQKYATCHSSPAKQNTTPARSNMGHTHPSRQEQSCQGATYYNQSSWLEKLKNKTRPITSGSLKF